MSEEIYRVVVDYIKSRNDRWKFIFGREVYDKKRLLKKMEEDEEFRKFIIEEIVKTAVDIFMRGER